MFCTVRDYFITESHVTRTERYCVWNKWPHFLMKNNEDLQQFTENVTT